MSWVRNSSLRVWILSLQSGEFVVAADDVGISFGIPDQALELRQPCLPLGHLFLQSDDLLILGNLGVDDFVRRALGGLRQGLGHADILVHLKNFGLQIALLLPKGIVDLPLSH